MIVHIVMFKFKEEDKREHLLQTKEMLETLPEKIQELNAIEVGINFDESARAFDLSLYSTFDTKEDLATYAVHPAHLQVVEFIKTVVSESKVVDYIN